MSEVTLGTWGLAADSYGRVDDARFDETVRAAIEAGVTTIDMAPLWGDGRAERIVAEAIRGERDRVVLVTRAGAVRSEGALAHRFDRESLIADCEASLERLDTDRIELWLLHNPPSEAWAQDELQEAIAKLRDDGKIVAWGASVGDAEAGRAAISAGAQALCLPYNLFAADELNDLAGEISIAGCGVLACSPLCYGLLAGTWSEGQGFATGDHRRNRWRPSVLRERIRQADLLRFLVHDGVPSLAQAAVRYVLANSVVTTAVVGARSPEQIEELAGASDGPPYLPEEDLARIPQVLAAVGA